MKQVTSEHINDYLDFIMDDYVDWCGRANIGSKQMSESKWVAEEGRKYIKIIHEKVGGTQRSVHSFIVKEATKKFGVGDVLMAASWKAPATNFARATVFDTDSFEGRIRWSGIC